MALQVFGTRKCPLTRKLERYLKERGIKYQFIDLAASGDRGPISAGELRAIAAAVGREALLDRESKHFTDRGLSYMDYDPEEEALKDPLLLKTPILRDGKKAAIGDNPQAWRDLAGK